MIQKSWKRDELINQKNKAAKKEGKYIKLKEMNFQTE